MWFLTHPTKLVLDTVNSLKFRMFLNRNSLPKCFFLCQVQVFYSLNCILLNCGQFSRKHFFNSLVKKDIPVFDFSQIKLFICH